MCDCSRKRMDARCVVGGRLFAAKLQSGLAVKRAAHNSTTTAQALGILQEKEKQAIMLYNAHVLLVGDSRDL